ncbi:hypothetical protein RRG08_034150 [Elysia crispata]|uniref:Uncharacterized protein n=1 Tax=Elysia crispata TaxID=231223 RepID=A0AAE1DHQ2_9GAST|nr:hypothetical protein RRG08_034150 [Elysia crispata]
MRRHRMLLCVSSHMGKPPRALSMLLAGEASVQPQFSMGKLPRALSMLLAGEANVQPTAQHSAADNHHVRHILELLESRVTLR